MSGLVWVPQQGGFRQSIGARGVYRLRQAGPNQWHVSGIGHDGLPMLAIPADGRVIQGLSEAESFVDGVDRAAVAGEMSGS